MPVQSPDLTPEQFECGVMDIIESTGYRIESLDVRHREVLRGCHGAYEVDITVRFEALGAKFLVLVECKQHRNPIKREVVQILNDRVREIGAHKGIIFSTARFQRGAVQYADAHGIALIQLADGKACLAARAHGLVSEPPPGKELPPHVGWLTTISDEGREQQRLVGSLSPAALADFLDFGPRS